jgi:hypothetical protein
MDVAIASVTLSSPYLHHRDPLLKVQLIVPLPCLRDAGDCHHHLALDTLDLGIADNLEHEKST